MDFFHNEFEVYPLEPSGLHYILPPRKLGRLRIFGYVFIAIGIASIIAGFVVIGQAVAQQIRGNAIWIDVVMSFRNYYLGIGIVALTAGWLVVFGRSEVKLQKGKVTAIKRAGLFRVRRKQNADKVPVLELFDRNFSIYGIPVSGKSKADYCVVRAGTVNLAPGYPYQTCLLLAEHLQDHWASALGLKDPAAVPHVIDGTQHAGTEDDVWPDEFIVQPTASNIQLADSAEHLTLRIPPKGFKRDTKIVLLCSLAWLAFTATFTGFAIAKAALQGPDAVALTTFLAIFWIAGIGWLLYAIKTMRREAAIVVAGNRLMILTKNIFLRRRHEWRREEVRAVVAASASASTGQEPRIELQIRTVADKTIRLFTGRPADELDWLAAVIRRRLFVTPQNAAPAVAPVDEPKPQPRMVLESLADKW